MTRAGVLTADELRLINLVATRRFGGGGDPQPPRGVAEALAAVTPTDPHARAAALAATLLRREVFATAPLHTAMLALCCQLRLDGFVLVAPQGVAAGLIRELAGGAIDAAVMTRWLEDRGVPA